MFLRRDATGRNEVDYKATGLAAGFIFVILILAFVAFYIKFDAAVSPLLTTFSAGAGALFGALLGESKAP